MPATLEAVLVLLILVVPGFVAARLFKSPLPNALVSERQFIVLTVFLGILVHLIALPFTIRIWPEIAALWSALELAEEGVVPHLSFSVLAWCLAILMLVPLLVALVASSIWRWQPLQPFLGRFGLSLVEMTPQAWDWFFLTQRRGCWILAELDDGRLVGGEFGERSFASLSPYAHDLYLEREYYVDEAHNFGSPIPVSVGVWLRGAAVKVLHFYRSESEE